MLTAWRFDGDFDILKKASIPTGMKDYFHICVSPVMEKTQFPCSLIMERKIFRMKRWQKYFQPHIWLRGVEYYEDGAVELECKKDNCYTAVVSGSEDYDVKLELCGEKIQYMDCSCPYAAEGNNCKHMAAVLMAIEEDFNGKSASQMSPSELVDRIPETALRSLLANLLEENSTLYRQLLLKYGAPEVAQKAQVAHLRSELERIPEEYENRHGEISYEDAYDFACDIASFIETQAFSLAKSDSVLAAANMGWEAVKLYCQYDVDDSDGGSGYVGNAIRELYEGLLQLGDRRENQELFQQAVQQYRSPECHWLLADMAWELLLSGIWGKDLKKTQLQFLDAKIDRLKASTEQNEWQLQNAILSRLNAMEGSDPAARHSYMDEHLDIPEIRKRRAALYLQNHDSENAIRLLQDGKELAKEANHYGSEREFSRLLIDAYEQNGQKEAMLRELKFYIFRYRQDDLVMLMRMKAAIPQADWEELRGRYLSGKDTQQKGELMRHEQMWDALLEYVLQSDSVWEADRFEADLKGRFPAQMLAFYQKYLTGAAGRASNRKAYYSLMPYMKKLCKYPNGTKAAVGLAADWRNRYCRRSAMLDELQKAGF